MRNLLQYPVTDEERVQVLTRMQDEIMAEQRMGDIRPHILRDAIAQFREPTEEEKAARDARIVRLRSLILYFRDDIKQTLSAQEMQALSDDLLHIIVEGRIT